MACLRWRTGLLAPFAARQGLLFSIFVGDSRNISGGAQEYAGTSGSVVRLTMIGK